MVGTRKPALSLVDSMMERRRGLQRRADNASDGAIVVSEMFTAGTIATYKTLDLIHAVTVTAENESRHVWEQ